MKEEWLLARDEILMAKLSAGNDLRDAFMSDSAIIKAQLAKAEPLIRKDERDKIVEWVEQHFHANTGYECAIYLWDKRDWEALKGESK